VHTFDGPAAIFESRAINRLRERTIGRGAIAIGAASVLAYQGCPGIIGEIMLRSLMVAHSEVILHKNEEVQYHCVNRWR
jgi:hypothetical protein